ncbi:DNA (cytosine-5-)-methyltransferase [Acinetobacter sp. C26M]|uniref:DNA (cytosine-5-)-methyltransferase n=1 Tax=unclassified Acinetobacter TaxID=196816 RepID=UPI0020374FE2|nr:MULTISPECIES: DNA (cytosine-5-)-methyltransferase [unclassified Acinetobacter]USA46654.1 DNA (cytosine-5-)-methyltransferase [Acinetobacter sp. C26M]USA50138.1 DNA (cytosine-5-)-methyltransferase [Acinetobacter sp. C26G]
MKPKTLKALRNRLQMTQKQMADLLNVCSKTWQAWENGTNPMHIAFAKLLEQKVKNELSLPNAKTTDKLLKNKIIFSEYNQTQITKSAEDLAIITHRDVFKGVLSEGFTFIDLFAGIGGIRQSFENHGGKCIFSSEIDPFAKFTYYTNFGEVPFGDITKISVDSIPKHDILCAGFPCQPFSHIGKREGFEHPTQGTMFYEIVRIIKDKKTPVLFLENVPGLINHDDGNTLQIIIETLQTMGYKVQHTVLDASHFGVPQKRKRFYLVAFLDQKIQFEFPKPPMISKDIGEVLEQDITGYSISEHLQKTYLFKVDDGRPTLVDKNSTGAIKTLVSTYHKIQRLTGTFVKDGETGIRLLTTNECKAIMGFPENFVIPVSRTQMYRQMGNSVVVPVVTKIAEQISLALKNAKQKSPIENFELELS